MSPVSENARRAAARIELFLASAVSRRRRGGSPPDPAGRVAGAERVADAARVAGLVTRSPRFRASCGEYVPTFIVTGSRTQRPDQARWSLHDPEACHRKFSSRRIMFSNSPVGT